mgnify:CR=1 FL=1|tara:strand:- start:380 stop:568 length:189 start_codon:yes stop_codon:yes gene_type:complete
MNKDIIKMVKSRLDLGAKKYKKQNLVSDGRDFVNEALEEALDLSIYISMRLIELKNRREDES